MPYILLELLDYIGHENDSLVILTVWRMREKNPPTKRNHKNLSKFETSLSQGDSDQQSKQDHGKRRDVC